MNNTLKSIFIVSLLLTGATSHAETLRIGGTGAALGGMAILGTAFETRHPGTTVEVLSSLGSSGGVKALVAGAIDISVASRNLKDSERELGAIARVYAHTPLAVVTSMDTSVDRLTSEDLVSIYSGVLTHWPDGTRIRVIMRPVSESDTQLLRSLSEPMAQAVDFALKRPGLVSATNDQENAEMLEELPGSIGVVSLGQIATERRRLKVLSLDNQMPDAMVVIDPETAFSKSLFIVSTPDSRPLAITFIDFVFSVDGREILAANDHSPAQ